MSRYIATVQWDRLKADFINGRYSRRHIWEFDGNIKVPASSSPHVVPVPMSDENAVDPEEAFVASIASCHMLWFLSIARNRGYCVDHYLDRAEGFMGRGENGLELITDIYLKPDIRFCDDSGEPDSGEISEMHQEAHENCFIARSVKSRIHIE